MDYIAKTFSAFAFYLFIHLQTNNTQTDQAWRINILLYSIKPNHNQHFKTNNNYCPDYKGH
jgi:hypothetical protein